MPIFVGKFDLGALFDCREFSKGTFWTPSSAKKLPAITGKISGRRTCRDPAFHEPMVIVVPLGPTGFQKLVLGLKIEPFSFFCVLFVT